MTILCCKLFINIFILKREKQKEERKIFILFYFSEQNGGIERLIVANISWRDHSSTYL
jgi:hypothetical protein